VTIVVENLSIGTPLNSGSGGTTGTITTNVACAAGATIVLVAYSVNGHIASAADNSGNGYTWAVDRFQNNGANNVGFASLYASAGLASGTVITVTYDVSTSVRIIAGMSWTGGASASRLDQQNSGTAFGSGAPWGTPSITPTVSASIVCAAYSDFGTSGPMTSTPTAPWLEWADLNNSDSTVTAVYQIVADMTARSGAGTWSKSTVGDQCSLIVNYKQGSATAVSEVFTERRTPRRRMIQRI
jgi:hypothetical protein